MKFRAKVTNYMKEGENKGKPWIIKGKIYDLIEKYNEYIFKSEISNEHWIEYDYLDEYFEIIPDEPLICKALGVNVNDKFNIKNIACNPCIISSYGVVLDSNNEVLNAKYLLRAINDPSVVEVIKWNDEQKEIFKALKVLGFNYIVRDSDYTICAYESEPKKCKYEWQSVDDIFMVLDSSKILNQPHLNFIDWEDEEPFEIPDVE